MPSALAYVQAEAPIWMLDVLPFRPFSANRLSALDFFFCSRWPDTEAHLFVFERADNPVIPLACRIKANACHRAFFRTSGTNAGLSSPFLPPAFNLAVLLPFVVVGNKLVNVQKAAVHCHPPYLLQMPSRRSLDASSSMIGHPDSLLQLEQ